MKVLHDFIIVKEEEKAEQTPGGLYVAPTSKNNSILRKGTVLEVGLGCPTDGTPEDLKTGKTVLFDIRDAVDLSVEGEKFLVIKLDQLVAILD